MDKGTLFGRGISFPPRIGPDGRLAWSAGAQNIHESIRIILMTEVQERVMLPEFGGGLQSYLFEPNIVATHRLIEQRVAEALTRWEPRLRVREVTAIEDPEDDDAALVTIQYLLVATGAAEQMTLQVRLSG